MLFQVLAIIHFNQGEEPVGLRDCFCVFVSPSLTQYLSLRSHKFPVFTPSSSQKNLASTLKTLQIKRQKYSGQCNVACTLVSVVHSSGLEYISCHISPDTDSLLKVLFLLLTATKCLVCIRLLFFHVSSLVKPFSRCLAGSQAYHTTK